MIFSFRKDDLPSASNPNRAERGRQNWLSNGRNTNSCQLILNQERGKKLSAVFLIKNKLAGIRVRAIRYPVLTSALCAVLIGS